MNQRIDHIQFIVIDLFCGAGGTTVGFEDAEFEKTELFRFMKSLGLNPPRKRSVFCKMAKVVACVNHDPIAIKSHWANNPDVEHFEEDITDLYGFIRAGILLKSAHFMRLIRLIEMYRAFYPEAKVILWASLECTNFSKAKGGKPRDPDSRTLAHHLFPYIICLDPHYIKIENVVEFMSWGPLDVTGRPVSRKNGQEWLRWRKAVCNLGYRDEWRELNAADFGALTSRNRLFGCFAKPGLIIVWPEPTHSKNPERTSIIKPLRKWEPVKKALDFSDEGNSVFNRKKALSSKTMQRLFMGCVKHIAGGKDAFLSRYYSGTPEHRNHDLEHPAGVVTTNNRMALVKASFIDQRNGDNPKSRSSSVDETVTATGGNQQLVTAFISKAYSGKPEDKNSSIESPSPTVTTKPHESLVQAHFVVRGFSSKSGMNGSSIDKPFPTITTQHRERIATLNFISNYNGVNGGKHDNSHSVEGPTGSITTGDRHAKVQADFIQKYYSSGGQHNSIDEPASSLTTKDRLSKVHADFFLDKQFRGDHNHQSVDQPAGCVMPVDKHKLVKAEKWLMNTNYDNVGSSMEDPSPVITADRHHHYLINPSWGGNSGSVEQPCYVVIARQDKAPLYLVACKEGPVAVPVYDDDCEWTIKLKEFMALYGIADIKMRMLKVTELKLIQGFTEDYILLGNQTDQKKFIGNAVHPTVVKHWVRAMSKRMVA